MDNFRNDSLSTLEQSLRNAADGTRPTFSPALHERILAAIDDCDMLPAPSWGARHRRSLALAASVLVMVAGGLLVGGSMWGRGVGSYRGGVFGLPGISQEGSAAPAGGALANHDPELMARALAAADHWGWLDDDTRSAAAWFVADLPSDQEWPDSTAVEDDDDAEVGS